MIYLYIYRFTHNNPSHNLLIYTRFRSGSSFVGSLFSHHPDVYYVFESMKFVEFSRERNDLYTPEVVNRRIQEVLSCTLKPMLSKTYSITGKKYWWYKVRMWAK